MGDMPTCLRRTKTWEGFGPVCASSLAEQGGDLTDLRRKIEFRLEIASTSENITPVSAMGCC